MIAVETLEVVNAKALLQVTELHTKAVLAVAPEGEFITLLKLYALD